MDINKFLDSKIFKIVILCIAVFMVLAFVFNLGVFVGEKKAEFSFKWAEKYHKNFGGPEAGFFGNMMEMGRQFTEANGVFGEIININNQTITIKGIDNIEKSILVGDKTTLRFQRDDKKFSDLKIGDSIVVVGQPNDNGQIEANLIRVMPPQLNQVNN